MTAHPNSALTSLRFRLSREMVENFAQLTGDSSSLHMDPKFGRQTVFGTNIVHGMLSFAFIHAIPLPEIRGGIIKRMSARFARPVFAGDTLQLNACARYQDGGAKVEFVIKNSDAGPVITGLYEVQPDAEEVVRHHQNATTGRIPKDSLTEQNLAAHEIEKGHEAKIQFSINDRHIDILHALLESGLSVNGSDAEHKMTRSFNPANLLGAFMISPLVGMCIPGRLGLLTTFDATFTDSLKRNTAYDFVGKVTFKSISAATVMESFSIAETQGHAVITTGKITSKINQLTPLTGIASETGTPDNKGKKKPHECAENFMA